MLMQDLINEYKEALKKVRELKEGASEEDRKLLGSMESDLRYSLQWMKTSRRPGNRRGVERLAAYQREKPFDPILIQQYFYSLGKDEKLTCFQNDPHKMIDKEKHNMVSKSDKIRIEVALSTLSPLEREVYLMSRGHCLSFSEISRMLGIAKGTVQKMIERAEKKIITEKGSKLLSLDKLG
jgi:RNA polymerase sigma-70 factor (ECF subfamily)